MANKNFKRPNNVRTIAKEKVKPETYTKTYASFEEAFSVLANFPGFIGDIIYDSLPAGKNTGDDISLPTAQQVMMNIMNDNLPDLENKKNTFWQITLSSNRCFLKTGRFVGFGWDVEKEIDDDRNIHISSVTLKVTLYNKSKTEKEAAFIYDNEWTLLER